MEENDKDKLQIFQIKNNVHALFEFYTSKEKSKKTHTTPISAVEEGASESINPALDIIILYSSEDLHTMPLSSSFKYTIEVLFL